MELVAKYVQAVWNVLEFRGKNHISSVANIYLATEDPEAADAFVQAPPKHWNVYIDVAIKELTPFRPPSSRLHGSAFMAKNTRGRGGLVHMGSLLVSMEANDYVLATGSTYGCVMNSLRTNIIDPRCGNGTYLVDVQRAEHQYLSCVKI